MVMVSLMLYKPHFWGKLAGVNDYGMYTGNTY